MMFVTLNFLSFQWDVLSNGNPVQEVAHIANGSHPGNCISVLRVRHIFSLPIHMKFLHYNLVIMF